MVELLPDDLSISLEYALRYRTAPDRSDQLKIYAHDSAVSPTPALVLLGNLLNHVLFMDVYALCRTNYGKLLRRDTFIDFNDILKIPQEWRGFLQMNLPPSLPPS